MGSAIAAAQHCPTTHAKCVIMMTFHGLAAVRCGLPVWCSAPSCQDTPLYRTALAPPCPAATTPPSLIPTPPSGPGPSLCGPDPTMRPPSRARIGCNQRTKRHRPTPVAPSTCAVLTVWHICMDTARTLTLTLNLAPVGDHKHWNGYNPNPAPNITLPFARVGDHHHYPNPDPTPRPSGESRGRTGACSSK